EKISSPPSRFLLLTSAACIRPVREDIAERRDEVIKFRSNFGRISVEKEMKTEPAILFSSFRLDPDNARLWHGSQVIRLRPKSFAVLRYLLERPGRLVTKEELLNDLWPNTYVSDARVKDSIREIRKALGDDPRAPQFVETVHRRGYRWLASLRSTSPVPSTEFQVQSSSPAPSPQHLVATLV